MRDLRERRDRLTGRIADITGRIMRSGDKRERLMLERRREKLLTERSALGIR